MSQDFSAIKVLMATGALLALVVGLYSLVGRERKAPYISNEAFKIFLFSSIGAAFDIAALLIPQLEKLLTYVGATFLLFSFVLAIHQTYRIYRRFVAFLDSVSLKYTWLYQRYKAWRRKSKLETEFEYNAKPIDDDLIDELKSAIHTAVDREVDTSFRESLGNSSICVALEHHGQSNALLASACALFLKRGYRVQYMTASRHPIEFIDALAAKLKLDKVSIEEVGQKILVVDAYTPHFGFLDSVYQKRTIECTRKYGIKIIPSKSSYAGVHTSCQNVFNMIKKDENKSFRAPILVIYENMYALSDLESPDQYRIFVRHVLPAEKLWAGMLTIFTEVNPAEGDWSVLSSYASMRIYLRQKPASKG